MFLAVFVSRSYFQTNLIQSVANAHTKVKDSLSPESLMIGVS